MRMKFKKDTGSSMVEMTIIIGLLSLTALTALPNLRYKLDCKLHLTSLALDNPVVYHQDGSASVDMMIPQSCSIIYFGYNPGPEGLRYQSVDPASKEDRGSFSLTLPSGEVVLAGRNADRIGL